MNYTGLYYRDSNNIYLDPEAGAAIKKMKKRIPVMGTLFYYLLIISYLPNFIDA
jgi:hypothetical protein